MINQFSRTELLIGKEAIEKLQNSKVAVFGIGGVGSYVTEALVRAGIQNFILVDNDVVSLSNLNRQLIATNKTIGKYKVDVMEERILEINPNAKVEKYKEFYMPDSKVKILDKSIDYVIDAIDTITAKIELVVNCNNLNIPIISSMGTGNKLDPTMFEIADIYKTSICPLAKIMRKELRNRGIKQLKVIYSKEEPIKINSQIQEEKINNQTQKENNKEKELNEDINNKDDEVKNGKKNIPGSISFVPSVAGLIIAGEVIKDIMKINHNK